MTNLILGAICDLNINQIDKWIESTKEHFKGVIILLDYGSTDEVKQYIKDQGIVSYTIKHDHFGKQVEKFNPNTGQVSVTDSYTLVHNSRFFHTYQLIADSIGKYKYVFLTDVRDVYLQGDPIKWLDTNLGDKLLVFASEGLTFENEPWGKDTFLKNFGPYFYREVANETIYNVGVVGGYAEALKDFALFNYLLGIGHQVADQVGMNLMLKTVWFDKVKKAKSEEGLAIHCGTFMDKTKPENIKQLNEPEPYIKDKEVYTHDGKKYIFVHQYDRIPELNVNK